MQNACIQTVWGKKKVFSVLLHLGILILLILFYLL